MRNAQGKGIAGKPGQAPQQKNSRICFLMPAHPHEQPKEGFFCQYSQLVTITFTVTVKVKGKGEDHYIAPQLPNICRISSAVVTDRAGIQPRPQPKPAVTDFAIQPHVSLP